MISDDGLQRSFIGWVVNYVGIKLIKGMFYFKGCAAKYCLFVKRPPNYLRSEKVHWNPLGLMLLKPT